MQVLSMGRLFPEPAVKCLNTKDYATSLGRTILAFPVVPAVLPASCLHSRSRLRRSSPLVYIPGRASGAPRLLFTFPVAHQALLASCLRRASEPPATQHCYLMMEQCWSTNSSPSSNEDTFDFIVKLDPFSITRHVSPSISM